VRRSQKNPQGGRVAKEAPIHVSNVMLYCGKCNGPVRVSIKIIEKQDARGKRRREKERICKKCGESLG
jgi:large subunit ribosomal protein L24